MRRSTAALVAILALAAVWWAGAWSTTGERVEQYARLQALAGAPGVLGALADRWDAFVSDPGRLELTVLLLYLACLAAALAAAWLAGRSAVLAAGAGLVLVASPFPGSWIDRPLGAVQGLAVLGGIVLVAAALRGGPRAEAISAGAGGLAVLAAGWPLLALVPLAFAAGAPRTAPRLLAAALVALAVRAAIGVPPADLAGSWDPSARHAVDALRTIVFLLAALPAVAYAATRPALAPRLRAAAERLGRRRVAAGAAAVVLALAAGLLGHAAGGAALFLAETTVVLIAVDLLAAGASLPVLRTAGAVGGAVVLLGAAHRLAGPPADDAARVARDRATLRAAAPAGSIVVVEDPSGPFARWYAPAVVDYLAGRGLDVTYRPDVPERLDRPVLMVTDGGLNRVDRTAAALRELDAARKDLSVDLQAQAAAGRINDPRPVGTPSGHGVIPAFPLAAVGPPIAAITVISGYTYTFERIPVAPGSRLVYADAKVFSVGGDARATVRIEVPGRPAVVVQDDLPPGPVAGPRAWRFRSVPIPAVRPAVARIVFAASSPGGNSTGNWVAFAQPAVVRR